MVDPDLYSKNFSALYLLRYQVNITFLEEINNY